MIRRLLAASAVALVLAACGGDASGRYDAQVEATRDAVRAGDREAALSSLEELAADARRAHAEGGVSDEELFELNALVDQARTQVAEQLPEPTTTTTSTPTTTTAPAPPPAPPDDVDDDDGREDDGRGKKGKGRGGDDGDDDD